MIYVGSFHPPHRSLVGLDYLLVDLDSLLLTSLELTVPLYSKVLIGENANTVYNMVRQNLLLTLDFLIRIFKPSDEVVFFQSEEIQFARVNHYRKQHFNRSNRSDKLGMSFGKAISKFFDRNMTDEIFSLIKELRPSFDDLTISYNSSNIKGDASFKINKFMYGNPGMLKNLQYLHNLFIVFRLYGRCLLFRYRNDQLLGYTFGMHIYHF